MDLQIAPLVPESRDHTLMKKLIIGVIPARLASTRLPRKMLRPISGRPMVEWVYRQAAQFPRFQKLLVATDSIEIKDICSTIGIPAMMTSPDHVSGTDRLHEVMSKLASQLDREAVYVNIQGDEPMVTARHIELLVQPFDDLQTQVTTLKTPMSEDAAREPDNVKVVTARDGRALYFSRSPIPFHRDAAKPKAFFKHLGFYAYSRASLEAFHHLPPSPLELSERLEQLRFLENGIPIQVLETHLDTIGVDTEEDVARVEALLRRL
jgi:3-deoxy-manno-octulosonate cytidylyltransferase (CMP-KDO synthetase)